MKRQKYPRGWNRARVERVLRHYEHQTEEQAVAEDEAGYRAPRLAMVGVPVELVPAVRRLISRKIPSKRPA